jgi:hypothetical protein
VRWLLLIATLASAAAGTAFASLLVFREAAAPARSAGMLRVGVARLPLPAGWKPLRRSPLAELPGAASARAPYFDVAIDVRMPDDPSLLPGPMLPAAGGTPSPELRRRGGHAAWSYDLPGRRAWTRISVLALPTTGGVVTVACTADESYAFHVALDCEEALASLQLAAAPLPPAPETAVRIVAPRTIARLDDVRKAARRALASTRSPRRRAAAARRIAAAYGAAARRLAPLARGAARPLPRALAALARDHRALAVASARRDAPAARRAGRAINRGERGLASQLAVVSP